MKIYMIFFIIIVIALLSYGAALSKSNASAANMSQDQRRQLGGSKNSRYTTIAIGLVAFMTVLFIVSRMKTYNIQTS